MPDATLKAAMEQIKPVLKEFDCPAVVILASRTHMEYLHEISPSWSAAWFEGEPPQKVLRVRAMGAGFPSPAAHQQCLEATVGMLIGFGDACEHTQHQMAQAAGMIGKHFEVRHVTQHEGGTTAKNPVQDHGAAGTPVHAVVHLPQVFTHREMLRVPGAVDSGADEITCMRKRLVHY